MRRLMMAALAASVTVTPFLATAQTTPRQADKEYRKAVRDANKDYRNDLNDANTQRAVNKAQRERARAVADANKDYRGDTRDWRKWRNYDYNRLPAGQRYYNADQYYRDGSYYQPRRLQRTDRIYRGSNGRYYCRRSDGTTGLIIGGAIGGLIGNSLSNGRSSTLGTLLGVAGGAALGSSIDRGQVQCR
ncbi:glycine zipper 2TM domain-containing protein [Sphingomonas sp.]|uniref:glycine zipper 2TM domain-containing protein n=1 Tax=Sphingomonas sp. TaxID=28214 RepID=UPI002E3629D1|nr:glycine zipper 2TM domain-containing protein [Sphingomonas sp.]HEX4695605.1 glycine zipper 2TM domain-containing protein [Sphingomonas sp.]